MKTFTVFQHSFNHDFMPGFLPYFSLRHLNLFISTGYANKKYHYTKIFPLSLTLTDSSGFVKQKETFITKGFSFKIPPFRDNDDIFRET